MYISEFYLSEWLWGKERKELKAAEKEAARRKRIVGARAKAKKKLAGDTLKKGVKLDAEGVKKNVKKLKKIQSLGDPNKKAKASQHAYDTLKSKLKKKSKARSKCCFRN